MLSILVIMKKAIPPDISIQVGLLLVIFIKITNRVGLKQNQNATGNQVIPWTASTCTLPEFISHNIAVH